MGSVPTEEAPAGRPRNQAYAAPSDSKSGEDASDSWLNSSRSSAIVRTISRSSYSHQSEKPLAVVAAPGSRSISSYDRRDGADDLEVPRTDGVLIRVGDRARFDVHDLIQRPGGDSPAYSSRLR